MRYLICGCLLFSLSFLLSFSPSFSAEAAESLDTIIIDTGYDKQTKIAVVPFARPQELERKDNISNIVSFDLARSGQFSPLEIENMLSIPHLPKEVSFRDWRILGMDYLLIGRAAFGEGGRIAVTYHLYDVPGEREISSETIVTSVDKWRDASHKISDDVFQTITGIRGAFSTKIMYVLAQNIGTSYAHFKLEVADVDGERVKTLFESSEPLLSASWSPDGRRVAYSSFEGGRPSIIIQEIATGARRKLTQFKGINSAPAFSPDGREIALVLSRDGNTEIYVMNLATERLRRVTRHHAIDTEPSWTPEGNLIFTSDRGGKPQIYKKDLSTGEIERLTWQGDYNARARLLPDGKHMVYVHRNNGVFHIAWMDIARDDVRVLTRTSLDESPSLAPNGTMLIYATQDNGRGILAAVSTDGRVKYRLPSSTGDVREPAWSPYLEPLK